MRSPLETNLSLLNEGHEKLKHVIDVLHEPLKGKEQKRRTYRWNTRELQTTFRMHAREKSIELPG